MAKFRIFYSHQITLFCRHCWVSTSLCTRKQRFFFIKDGGIQNPDGSSPQERISLFADGRFPICRELCCQPVVSNELLRPDIIVCQNPNWTFEAPSRSLRSSEIGSRLLLGIETSISAQPLIRCHSSILFLNSRPPIHTHGCRASNRLRIWVYSEILS